ncbi:MAG TPA: endonuclease domain-containing protein [Candidatus Angelobacter sp.]|nr:endonuclease domain-containing protein [Candidatus Angelobacter sp.]
MKKVQRPKEIWEFIHKPTGKIDKGILPSEFGCSNDFAFWEKHNNYSNGGYWRSRKFRRAKLRRRQSGNNRNGIRARFTALLHGIKTKSRLLKYALPNFGVDKMLYDWETQKGRCAACKGAIIPKEEGGLSASYDHSHFTGEGRGFLHRGCNLTEGHLSKMTNEEFNNYLNWILKIQDRNFA